MFDILKQDIRYGLRNLLRNPGFTLVAVLSLALGIGANTAIFTLADAVFLNPLPVEKPSEILELYTVERTPKGGIRGNGRSSVSYTNYQDFRDQNQSFTGLAGFMTSRVTLTGKGEPKPQPVMLVTANYFDVLGVKALSGRTFEASEDQKLGGNNVTVISHSMWMRVFGGDPSIVGQTVNFNSTTYNIVGVAPPDFKGTLTVSAPEIAWIPISMHPQVVSGPLERLFNARRSRFFSVFGRLKAGVSEAQALADMKTIAARLEQEYPNDNRFRSCDVAPLMDAALGGLPRDQMTVASIALMSVVGLVLLIASANIANLLLARSARRAREMGIRTALGAERGRLIRQLLTESLLLSILGGIGGFALGWVGCRVLWSFRPPFLQQGSVSLPLDLRILAFTAAVTLFTGILFGIAPALRASTPDLAGILKSGGRGAAEAFAKTPLGAALVVGEVALALVALIGAGLFIRSAQNAQQLNPGFDAKNLIVFTFDLASRNYTNEQARQFLKAAAQKAAEVPGVQNVAVSTNAPLSRGIAGTIIAEGQDADPNDRGTPTVFSSVTPGFFDTMKIRLDQGRFFTDFDRQDTNKVGVISQAMAKFFWPGQNAVGKRFRFFRETFYREVVGIVGDTVTQNMGEAPTPIAYLPLEQEFAPVVTLHVRTSVRPETLMRTVMSAVQSLDSNLALTGASTAEDLIVQGLWAPRVGAGLFSLFGLLGMLLAAVGIYGVVAYMVAQRTNEIGIRMALGARPADVLQMVVGQSMRLVGSGVVVGILSALALTRLAKSLLFSLSPNDPLTFIAVAVIILIAALIAAWLPARRAAKIDPLIALRQD